MGTLHLSVPTFDAMMNPLIQALKDLGGSGTIQEIDSKVAELMGLSDEQLELLHDPERGSQTEVEYRLAWTRTYLKKYGILENSKRSIWALTAKGRQSDSVNPNTVKRYVREMDRKVRTDHQEAETLEAQSQELSWQDELLSTMLKISSAAFERLAQRLLRESGFTQVEVTGKSGDGGIDGKGIMRLGDLLSFHVYFQCKRYKGSVGASEIRDFRGAMTGRADKGLFITTGNFTPSAKDEAIRDGAPPIDLIDGDQLVALLKKLELGVQTKIVEKEEVMILPDWFAQL